MIVSVVQRWRDQRGSYRPAGEPIATRDYEIAPIADDATPRAFVLRHHYAGSFPAARFRFGLYTRGELVGVAVFSEPVNKLTLACLPGDRQEKAELGRLVLLDDVPANGESWFVARCFEHLRARERLVGAVFFSDPVPRTDAAGHAFFKGHIGTVYQALNAVYLGRADSEVLRLLPDGRVLHKRAMAKIRKRERGWTYAAALLEQAGAKPLGPTEDAAGWLAHWTPLLCRKLRHAGNVKYAIGFTKAAKRHLPPSLPYLKLATAQTAH